MSQQQDDDGTVIRPPAAASAVAPNVASPAQRGAAASSGSGQDVLSLRIGARVAEFEITGRIGDGGFSIVYLAMDHSLERTVALKEYMPMSLATRVGATQVEPRSERYRDTFDAGLKSFVNEAKLLAQFDHPSLVKVYRFWEANGTAYMVMPFYQGITVKDAIRAMPGPPDEAWLMALLAPLTQALVVIHAEHCYHRDIAPDNVILLADSGKPLLLDFGAARRVIGDMTQALTVILKAGYAPVEQYAEIPGMKQGPWTDVYALAAVVYWAITGATPPSSVGRLMSDSFVPLAEGAAGRYSAGFLAAIDRALAVRPEQRTQTIETLRLELGLPPEVAIARPPWNDADATVIRPVGPRPASTSSTSRPITDVSATAPRATLPAHVAPLSPPPPQRTETRGGSDDLAPTEALAPQIHARQATVAPEPPRELGSGHQPGDAVGTKAGTRRTALVVAAAGAAVAAVAIWWAVQRPGAATPPSVQQGSTAVTPEPAPSVMQGGADSRSAAGMASPAADAPSPPSTSAAAAGPPAADTPAAVDTPAAKPDLVAPVAPVDSVPGTPPKQVTKKATLPDNTAAARTDSTGEHASKRPDAATPERVQADSSARAECGRIFQRLSLGETSPELLERLKSLKCR